MFFRQNSCIKAPIKLKLCVLPIQWSRFLIQTSGVEQLMYISPKAPYPLIALAVYICPLTLYCPRSLSLTQVPAGPGFPCALFPPLLFLTLVHSCGLVLYGANMHYLLTLSAVSSHPNFSTVYCWCTDYYGYGDPYVLARAGRPGLRGVNLPGGINHIVIIVGLGSSL